MSYTETPGTTEAVGSSIVVADSHDEAAARRLFLLRSATKEQYEAACGDLKTRSFSRFLLMLLGNADSVLSRTEIERAYNKERRWATNTFCTNFSRAKQDIKDQTCLVVCEDKSPLKNRNADLYTLMDKGNRVRLTPCLDHHITEVHRTAGGIADESCDNVAVLETIRIFVNAHTGVFLDQADTTEVARIEEANRRLAPAQAMIHVAKGVGILASTDLEKKIYFLDTRLKSC